MNDNVRLSEKYATPAAILAGFILLTIATTSHDHYQITPQVGTTTVYRLDKNTGELVACVPKNPTPVVGTIPYNC